MTKNIAMPGPLASTLILSLAEQLPGPYATLLLADMGADVIQIERPDGGDPARAFPDYYTAISRNKRSMCLDLKAASDRDAFEQLVLQADVMVEGYSPGTADRLGVGQERMRALNPRLIYASISGFGQDGPYRDRRGHDLSYQAVAGTLTLSPSASMSTPPFPLADMCAANFAALAITSALLGRERTGLGTFVDVSMTDCLTSWMTPFLVPRMNGGAQIDIGDSPAYGVFESADGALLALSIAHEDHFWQRLCHAIGLSEAALSHGERVARSAALRERIAAALKQQPLSEWQHLLDAAGIPWSRVNALDAMPEDAHLRQRGLFADAVRTDGTVEHHVRQPLKFSGYPSEPLRPAPRLGEHTTSIRAAFGLTVSA